MKIVADLEKCEGLGMCEAMANDYFEVDEDPATETRSTSSTTRRRSRTGPTCTPRSRPARCWL